MAPAGGRSSYRKGVTMAELAEGFMYEPTRPRKKAMSFVTGELIWKLNVLPLLGKEVPSCCAQEGGCVTKERALGVGGRGRRVPGLSGQPLPWLL